jgi:hypothetical protein
VLDRASPCGVLHRKERLGGVASNSLLVEAVCVIELVLRRNLHVHNRGIVDSRYVGEMNLDKLKLGEVAVIDEAYWNMASNLCRTYIDRVAAWANH